MGLLNKISNYWWYQLIGWGLVGLSFIFAAYSFRQLSSEHIQKTIIIMVSGIISTHLLRMFIKKRNWLSLPVDRILFRMSIAVIITSVLFSLLFLGLNYLAGLDGNAQNLDFTTRLFANVINLGIFIIPWVLFYYFYHYLVKSNKQQLDTLKLEAMVKELELKRIKAHINPHFIFNALNSIRALIDEDPRRARDAVTHLSNILRSSIRPETPETVPLQRELNIVKDYLALEHMRFEDRLRIEYDIDQDTLNQPVPPMMLQTLVENAIKHGIGRQAGVGYVKLRSVFCDHFHELVVENTGSLSDRNGEEGSARNGGERGAGNGEEGFGLSSTRNRLNLLFGNKADVRIFQQGELVVARILIPVTKL